MNFKAQIERDLKTVFHNSEEHAEVMEFYYNGNRYKVPVVVGFDGAGERKQTVTDHSEGIFLVDMILYVMFADLKVVPRKGRPFEIGDDGYTIVKTENVAGEIVIYLEMFDE